MITEFSIGCSKTINLGNFQSIRVEASMTVNPADEDTSGEGWDECVAAAQKILRDLLEQTYKAQLKELA